MIYVLQLVVGIYEVIKSGFKGRVQFTSQGRKNEHMVPMVEVSSKKVEYAGKQCWEEKERKIDWLLGKKSS